MPFPFILGLLALIGVGAAIAFWPHILNWAHQVVFPFFEDYLPSLTSLVRDAFVAFDQVAVTVRRAAKEAWSKLRPHLLSLVVHFRQQADGVLKEIEGWLSVDGTADSVERVYTRQKVDSDQLPPEVRQALMRHGKAEVDVKQARELEMEH